MNPNAVKLKKMASWTVAIFATIFAVVLAVLWLQQYGAGSPAFTALGKSFVEGWVMILITLVLCAGTYIVYFLYISLKK